MWYFHSHLVACGSSIHQFTIFTSAEQVKSCSNMLIHLSFVVKTPIALKLTVHANCRTQRNNTWVSWMDEIQWSSHGRFESISVINHRWVTWYYCEIQFFSCTKHSIIHFSQKNSLDLVNFAQNGLKHFENGHIFESTWIFGDFY